MCGSGYPTYPNFLPLALNFFFMPPTSEKLRGHIGLGLSICSSVRLYNFGLSECNRVKRKITVLSKDIKMIFFLQHFLIFLVVKNMYYAF